MIEKKLCKYENSPFYIDDERCMKHFLNTLENSTMYTLHTTSIF